MSRSFQPAFLYIGMLSGERVFLLSNLQSFACLCSAMTHSQAQMTSTTGRARPETENIGRAAFLVAAGSFLSRIFGLVRESVFAH